MAKLKYNIRQMCFYKLTKSKSKFWTPDCNVCVFHVSLSGQKKVSSHVNRQIKSGTRMRSAEGRKKRCEVRFVWSGSLTSTKSKIIGGAPRKDGEEKVGNELCLVQPLLLSLPLIEKYISTQLRNKFVSN